METLSRRKVDVCCIQETSCRGGNCRTIKGKDTRCKLYWSGNDKGTWKNTLTTDVHSARELHAPWMADNRRQAWGGSFLLLPRRHALSSRWLWTFNHNTCENRLEEVQGSATSSLFTPPLFQNTWPCVQLLCAERYAPCHRDLDIDKAKPPSFAAKWQGNDQTDLQRQAARNCHHQIHWATCATWHWGSGPHSEGEKTLMVWTCGTLQWCRQDSLWHTGWWKAWAWEAQDDMEAADREGLQRVEALGYQPPW